MQHKQRLVIVLEQINKRYSSIFFSKLVLLEKQQQTQVSYIRHYDIQCEAVQTLTDTLATKIKAIKFKSFYMIKFFRKEDMFKRKPKTQNGSFIHNYSTRSFYQRGNIKNKLKQDFKFAQTTRNSYKNGFDKTSEILSDIDYSMSALMNKMKYLNGRCKVRNQEDPQSPQLTDKVIKRKIILNKLNEIQNNLQQLMGQQLSQGNLNHITSSQITLRYNPVIQNNYKTTRQINKTFCIDRNDNF